MKWLVALLLVSGCLFWLFHDPAPSEEEVGGLYAGTYKGFVDQVALTKDHKFSQVLRLPNGETMKSSGTWRLTNKALDLDGYIFFIDEQVAGSSDKPIRTSVTFAADREMLIRDWGTGFYKLTRQ
jgi:hypothetical protein